MERGVYLGIIAGLIVLAIGVIGVYVLLRPVTIDDLDVTSGMVTPLGDGTFVVDTPQMRAYFRDSSGNAARLAFTYHGPTEGDAPLDSGELRRQIGIKLRAPDTCNTLYVMWHIEPSEEIVVSAKRNPGATTHDECGAEGYARIEPNIRASTTPIVAGEERTLAAELHERELSVFADKALVWRGTIPAEMLVESGRAGMRTDNAAFTVAPEWE